MNNTENDRSWNENFKNYVEFIVNHPAYTGLYYERKTDGTVKWVVLRIPYKAESVQHGGTNNADV